MEVSLANEAKTAFNTETPKSLFAAPLRKLALGLKAKDTNNWDAATAVASLVATALALRNRFHCVYQVFRKQKSTDTLDGVLLFCLLIPLSR